MHLQRAEPPSTSSRSRTRRSRGRGGVHHRTPAVSRGTSAFLRRKNGPRDGWPDARTRSSTLLDHAHGKCVSVSALRTSTSHCFDVVLGNEVGIRDLLELESDRSRSEEKTVERFSRFQIEQRHILPRPKTAAVYDPIQSVVTQKFRNDLGRHVVRDVVAAFDRSSKRGVQVEPDGLLTLGSTGFIRTVLRCVDGASRPDRLRGEVYDPGDPSSP